MGPRYVGIVVSCVLAGGELGPAGDDGVVGFEESFGHFHGGAHNNRVGAEPDMYKGPILFTESMEGLVREGPNMVKVSYDGPWFWAWWQIISPTMDIAEEEDEDGKGC